MEIFAHKKTLEPLYTANRESLFGLSRQEFRDNNFANSLLLNRMNSVLNQGNIDKPVGFYDFIGKILDYREWAAECNYVLHEVPLPMLHKTPEWLAFFPEISQSHHQNDESFYKQGVFLCEASECYGVKVLFPLGPRFNNQIDEVYGFFSNRLSFLCGDSDKWALRYMEGWPYIRHISNDFDYALFDFSYCANEVFEIDEPCIFLGSNQNYGHWLLDFLPKLYVIEQFEHLKNLPIVVGKLKEYQKESLELIGIDKNHPIIEIPQDKGLLYKFKKVFLSSKPPYGVVKDFLRKKLVKSIPRQGKGRRLYLSRKNQGVRNRVYNEDEISAFLQILGFEVIFPERLSIRETVEIFSQAEMIVSSVGAEFTNIAFTDNCAVILLMSNLLIESKEISYVSLLQQSFTLCDYLKPVISKVKEEGFFNINDDVSEYRVQDIGRAIIEAEAALKKMVI
jgi:hypothetical protein